jgi:hypothetical protein
MHEHGTSGRLAQRPPAGAGLVREHSRRTRGERLLDEVGPVHPRAGQRGEQVARAHMLGTQRRAGDARCGRGADVHQPGAHRLRELDDRGRLCPGRPRWGSHDLPFELGWHVAEGYRRTGCLPERAYGAACPNRVNDMAGERHGG